MGAAVRRAARLYAGAAGAGGVAVEMNAQEMWKKMYNRFATWHYAERTKRRSREEMYLLRREAALERIIARQQRAARKFSKAHHYISDENVEASCDPQDWFEFDFAFGLVDEYGRVL